MTLWIVLAALATPIIWGLRSGDRSLGTALRDHGVTALGTVTGTDPANHNTVFYRFTARGIVYSSGYFGDGPEGVASQLTVGQRIHVVYDSEDPQQSCYCDARTLTKAADLWRSTLAALFVTSVVSVVATISLTMRRTKGRSSK